MNPLLVDIPLEFESARLQLRSPRAGDGPEMNAAVRESILELRPWLLWAQTLPSLDESEVFARESYARYLARQELRLLLLHKETGLIVGGSGLHAIHWSVPRFEIGYWVRTRFRGQGYVSEAVAAISNLAFERLGARRVEIRVDDRNVRSWRIPERLGFTLEGTLRNDDRDVQGILRDTRVYSLVRGDA